MHSQIQIPFSRLGWVRGTVQVPRDLKSKTFVLNRNMQFENILSKMGQRQF